jgi:hypothetical protein
MFHLLGVKNRRMQNFHLVNQGKCATSQIERSLWRPIWLDRSLATEQYQLPSVYKGSGESG